MGSGSSKLLKQVRSDDPTLTSLDCLELKMPNGITPEFVEALTKNTHLEAIWINAKNLRDDDIRVLCETLKNNDNIKQIGLSANLISDTGCEYLAQLLNEKAVHILDLSANSISDEGVMKLADAIARSASITEFLIGGNPFTEVGRDALLHAFKQNKSLEIFVGFNLLAALGDEVPESQAEMLQDDPKNEATLHYLHQLHGFY